MRVDPSYITNLVGSLDQTQANEQQLSCRAVERREHHVAEPESGWRGRECPAAEPDSAGRLVHAELEPGDGAAAGGGFGAGQRGERS